MKIILIEENTWKTMKERFEAFSRKIYKICNEKQEKSLKGWLDNQDVCQILNISKRTLQTYRDNGILAYTQINRKMYYKPEDIQKIIVSISQKYSDNRRKKQFK